MLLVLFSVVVSALIYWLILRPQKYWRNANVEYEKPIPIIGMMWNILLQRLGFGPTIKKLYDNHPNVRYFGIYQFLKPILVIKDTDLIKRITIKDFDHFVDHQGFSRSDIDPLWSRNLLSAKGEKWHKMRAILSPSFTSSKMRNMYMLIEECSETFVQFIKDQDEEVHTADMKNYLSRYATDVIATCAFGIKVDSMGDPENNFYKTALKLGDFSGFRLVKFFLANFSLTIAKLLKVKIINQDLADFFRAVISDTVRTRLEKKIVRPDMVQLLLEARKLHPEADDLTDEDITAQAVIFFFAGFETTANLMSFVAYELAVNPNVQHKLRNEILDTLAANKGHINYDALMGMKYLDMVINETLRKWPPNPSTDREATKNYTIEPERPGEVAVHIKKGQLVWIPIYGLHLDPEIFTDPKKFDPERFNEDNKGTINPATYLPFGLGPRNCIGSRFVLMENKSLLVKLLQHFEIVPIEKTHLPEMKLDPRHFSFVAHGGMWLGLKKLPKN